MAGTKRSLQGDINIILNGLVRDGVIAGFSTNLGENSPNECPKITVVPSTATNPKIVKLAVRTALQQFLREVAVTVKAG